MWQLFLAPPSFIVLSVSHTKSQNGFSFAFWHPSKTTAHNLCILRIHRTQPNRYLYNQKHGSHNCLAPFINTWPACGRRSPPSTTWKNSQWWAALSLNLQQVVWISQQNMPASNIEWDVYGPAARPLPSATGAPHSRAQQDADNERACAESSLSLQAFCVHEDECLQGAALNYTHLQLAACNSSHQDEQKSPNILVQMAQWIANHSAFTIHFMS